MSSSLHQPPMVPPSLLFIKAAPVFFKPLSSSSILTKRPRIAHASTVWRSTTCCTLDPPDSSLNNAIDIQSDTPIDTPPEETVPDKYQGYLDGSRTVSIPLPLDVYLEETSQGEVYIDELVEGGNAYKSDLVEPGDVIIAVCLPFGDALLPLPKQEGLAMLMNQISAREEGLDFVMAVRKENLETLRSKTGLAGELDVVVDMDLIQLCCDKVFIDDYPIRPEREEEEQKLDLEKLRTEGFDV